MYVYDRFRDDMFSPYPPTSKDVDIKIYEWYGCW